jgi:hypothetical protein
MALHSVACRARFPRTVSLLSATTDQAVDPALNPETGETLLKVPLPISRLLKLNFNRLLNSERLLEVLTTKRWLRSLSQT